MVVRYNGIWVTFLEWYFYEANIRFYICTIVIADQCKRYDYDKYK